MAKSEKSHSDQNAINHHEPTRVLPADYASQDSTPHAAQETFHTNITSTFLPDKIDLTHPHQREFGDYELVEEIGRGGMGIVFKAREKKLNRLVALKMILGGQQAPPDVVKRFRIEAEAAAHLNHPGIVTVFDFGEHNQYYYFTMPFIEGDTLDEILKQSGALPEDDTAQLVKSLTDGLSYAHKKGIIHRDLKPSNIMIDEHGQPLIVDFGLARNFEMRDYSRVTQTGDIMGTPAYMSPEQVEGHTDKINAQTDIYSLGVILYECLSGQRPFSGNHATVLASILTKEPVPLSKLVPDIDPKLSKICHRAMAKSAQKRYLNMQEFGQELESWQQRYVNSESVHIIQRDKNWLKVGVPAVVALLLVILLVVNFLQGDKVHKPIHSAAVANRNQSSLLKDINSNEPKPFQPSNALLEVNYELSFDGMDDYIELPIKHNINTNLTLECFATPLADPPKRTVVFSNTEGAGTKIELIDKGYKEFPGCWCWVCYSPEGRVRAPSDDQYAIGKRVHLAGVYEGHSFRFYINGKLQQRTRIVKNLQPSAHPFWIGANPTFEEGKLRPFAKYFFHGRLDEIRISNMARYTVDFIPKDRLTADTQTLGLYHCDDAQKKTILSDSSGRNNHGIIHGARFELRNNGISEVITPGGR